MSSEGTVGTDLDPSKDGPRSRIQLTTIMYLTRDADLAIPGEDSHSDSSTCLGAAPGALCSFTRACSIL